MTADASGEYALPSDEGICDLCEQRPCQEDDDFCVECRAYMASISDTVVDPVEIVLSDHNRLHFLSDLDKQECQCGWKVESGPGLHRRHVAAHIYAALGLDGPAPWVLGPASEMADLMNQAAHVGSRSEP